MSIKLWPAFYLSILISIAAIVTLGYWFNLNWNLTSSLPMGIYRTENVDRANLKGKIVSFCPPDTVLFRVARDQGTLKWGHCPSGFAPLLKRVVAVPGDVVRVVNRVVVNGKFVNHGSLIKEVAAIYRSAPVSRTLTDCELWVMGDTEDSFDSRYFGSIDLGAVISTQQLLF